MRFEKGQEEPDCDRKCSDCGLDSCVLKEIELTGGYVSIQWAQWPPPPHSYQPSPRLSLAMLPGHLVHARIWQCGQLQWGHSAIWNLCLRGPGCCIRNPSYHHGRECTLKRNYWLFCSSTFSPLVFTQLHLRVHFYTIEIPLLFCSPPILSQTWLLAPSSAAFTNIPPCSFVVSSPHPACSLHFLPLAYCSIFFNFSPLVLLYAWL